METGKQLLQKEILAERYGFTRKIPLSFEEQSKIVDYIGQCYATGCEEYENNSEARDDINKLGVRLYDHVNGK